MNLIVTGMHRSGTTHFARLVESGNPELGVLHEPLNAELGIKGVVYWYFGVGEVCKFLHKTPAELFRDLALLRVKPRFLGRTPGENIFRTLGRQILGGAFAKSLRAAKQKQGVIVKDPFLFRVVSDSGLSNLECIVIYKHPLSNLLSVKRQGWQMDPESFPPDIAEYCDVANNCLLDFFSKSDVRIINLWEYLHQEFLATKTNSVVLVAHEDFCCYPENMIDYLYKNKIISQPERASEYAARTMQADKDGRVGGLHDFVRDSKSVAFEWQDQFSEGQKKIIGKTFGGLIDRLSREKLKL